MSFEDGCRLTRLRGELMYRSGEERPGTMAAVLGLDDAALEEVCSRVEAGICVPANFNSAAQTVMLGDCDVAVAGGAESMSRAPFASLNARFGVEESARP